MLQVLALRAAQTAVHNPKRAVALLIAAGLTEVAARQALNCMGAAVDIEPTTSQQVAALVSSMVSQA